MISKFQGPIVVVLLTLTLTFACKEDIDEVPPNIVVELPMENTVVEMPDTIIVAARVEDDRNIEFINLGLVDNELIPQGDRISVDNISNPKSFSLSLVIDDLDIESGVHYLEVFASDGTNDSREFIELGIVAIPKEYKGVLFIDSDGNENHLKFFDDAGQNIVIDTYDSDVNISPNSRSGTVSVFERSENRLQEINISTLESVWSVDNVLLDQSMLVDMRADDFTRSTRILSTAPRVLNYTKSGFPSGQFDLDPAWTPTTFFVDEDELWIGFLTPSGNRVSRLFKSTGFELDNFLIAEVPVQIGRLNNTEIIVVDGEGDIHILNPLTGGQFVIPVAGSGTVTGLVTVGADAYFCTESNLYRYASGSFQASIIYTSNEIGAISYDSVNQRLLLAEGGDLHFFLLNPLQNVGSFSLGTDISSLHTFYNK